MLYTRRVKRVDCGEGGKFGAMFFDALFTGMIGHVALLETQ